MIEKIKNYLLQIEVIKVLIRKISDWRWNRYITQFLLDVPEHKKKFDIE